MANAAVISQVQGGYRAEQPMLCSDEVYAIMLKCWSAKPADRPNFVQLATMLEGVDTARAGDSEPAAPSARAALQRKAVAVNDTYMTDEPAVEAAAADGDQYLTVDNTYFGAGDVGTKGGAEDEYWSVAAGLGGGDDVEC